EPLIIEPLDLKNSSEEAPSLNVDGALSELSETGSKEKSRRSGLPTKSKSADAQLAILERKLKSGNCSRAEIREARDLCTQVYQDYDPDNPEWKSAARAERLLENYDLDDET
ncbi:MAG: hypothetical protein WAK39_19015, partial [Pseudolabrys sp.]